MMGKSSKDAAVDMVAAEPAEAAEEMVSCFAVTTLKYRKVFYKPGDALSLDADTYVTLSDSGVVTDVDPKALEKFLSSELPGMVSCVVTHGTLKRDKRSHSVGAKLVLPKDEFVSLRKAGIVEAEV